MYLDRNRIIYRKEPCAVAETEYRFMLHLFPERPGDLPAERREYGFDNRGFDFEQHGLIREGKCLASAPLPDYPIARIRTGQHTADGEHLWRAEFPVP